MRGQKVPNLALASLVASCFIQIGAQLFALVVIGGTLAEAPPRSFAMLQGDYGYDSSGFWNVLPAITLAFFLAALATNWNTARRGALLLALILFVTAGLAAGLLVEPVFHEMLSAGYADRMDPALRSRAATWHARDWMVWGLLATSGLVLLTALMRPLTSPRAPVSRT